MDAETAMHRFIYYREVIASGKKLNPLQEKIFRLKKEKKSIVEIAKIMCMNSSSIYCHITCIRAKGIYYRPGPSLSRLERLIVKNQTRGNLL